MRCEQRIRKIANKYGYSEYMIKRYITFLGKSETIELLEANEEPLPITIQTNTVQIRLEILKKQLEEKQFEIERIPYTRRGLKIKYAPFSIGATSEYLLGYYTVQGAGSIAIGDAVNPNPDDQVIDMCAAPGMKTLQLAQDMENKGIILALDRSWKRLKALEYNLARCGIQNVIIIQYDSKKLARLKYMADTILLDAPCTGSGIIRKDQKRKKSRGEEDIKLMARIQKQLIGAGIDCLNDRGRLIYSTCSLEPEENEEVINYALNKYPVKLIKPTIKIGSPGLVNVVSDDLSPEIMTTRRLWPHKDGTEGFFIGVLQKCVQ